MSSDFPPPIFHYATGLVESALQRLKDKDKELVLSKWGQSVDQLKQAIKQVFPGKQRYKGKDIWPQVQWETLKQNANLGYWEDGTPCNIPDEHRQL